MDDKSMTADDETGVARDGSPPPDLALLRDCLRWTMPPDRLFELRRLLWTDADAWDRLLGTATGANLSGALCERLGEKGLLPPPRPDLPRSDWGPGEILDCLYRVNLERRTVQTNGLKSIVACLNRAGIVPLLIKGARTLWLDHRPWRMMRDLDILIPENAIAAAQDALIADGFATDPDERERLDRHHYPPLFRADLPCSVELHQRGGNRYAELFCPTSRLWESGVRSGRERLEALILPDAEDCWHALVHHFFGHSGFARGLVSLRGLYEFAAGYADLDETARDRLSQMASADACGLAALDLFLAASIDGLGLEIAPDRRPGDDAFAAWERMRIRQDKGLHGTWRYPGYRETLALALSGNRVARVCRVTGRSAAAVRLQATVRLLPKISRSGRF